MNKATILIVEDDNDLREALVTTLTLAGYQYREANCAEAALSILEQHVVDLVVSDVNMPGMDGYALLKQVQRSYPGTPVMLMTAYGQINQAVSAMQAGAVDYLVKPFDPQTLTGVIKRCLGESGGDQKERGAIGEDPFSKRLFQLAKKVAVADSTVLISGESGTGKEVLARYIHDNSPRKDKPFVAINCAAIPENMLEAMLFGHEKGAFTGAYTSAPGKFEQANGGTILLDEVSEMDLGLQAKLLRVLQEREVERVGGRKPIPLDVRVLATTNRDLKEYVAQGRFREDVYYRLSVFPLQWKPLRERPLDILPLAKHLLSVHCAKMKLPAMVIDKGAEQALQSYAWPGNVRELDNAIQRALILQTGNRITAGDLCIEEMALGGEFSSAGMTSVGQAAFVTPVQAADDRLSCDELHSDDDDFMAGMEEGFLLDSESSLLGQDLRQREFQIIIDTLRKVRGRKNKAAETLGISPRTLRYKMARMRECGIDIDRELEVA
ncbi:MAG: sigma-54-dependent Fis family transcriptional regulator [Hahellaceae bacterium]|nr:sigma-54-dependent Fis family transcriptional regulator [Hahellaceae bacterium]